MTGSRQDNRGDHNTNVGSIEGDVNVYITNSRGIDATLVVGLWAAILAVFGFVSQRGHRFFEVSLLVLVVLAAVSIVLVVRMRDTRPSLVFVVLGLLMALSPMLWSDTIAVAVPDVVGANEDSARDDLRELGLEATTVLQQSEEPENRVIGQTPEPGTTADPGSVVSIVVSTGPGIQQVTVPPLIGKDEQTAADDLRQLGLNSNTVLQQSEEPENRVIGQTPEPGTTADPGSVVSIVVSTGPGIQQVTVPPLIGKDEQTAADDLRQLGLNSNTVLQQSEEPENRVIGQTPAAGTGTEPGTTINIIVSTGPGIQQVAVPSLIGKDEQTAADDLRQLGLNSNTVLQQSEEPEHRVMDQTPAPATRVDPGATVEIVVSTGPGETLVDIPQVEGTLENAARSVLSDAGFAVSVRTVASATSSEGRVLRSNPAAGTASPDGSPIELIVSSGPASACTELRSTPTIGISASSSLAIPQADGSMGGFEPELVEELLAEMCGASPQYMALTAAERFGALTNGGIDILITPFVDRSLPGLAFTSPYVLLEGSDGREGRAFAVRQNVSTGDESLRIALDASLVELIENGTWSAIHERNLGTPDYSISEMLVFVIPDS